MNYSSTRDRECSVSASQAIVQGLSSNGGLFVPNEFPRMDLEAMKEMDYPHLAQTILSEFLTGYNSDFISRAVTETYGNAFQGKAGHVEAVEKGIYALELWHGPTCAFKDYALQLMPKLLVEAKKNLDHTEVTRILVATSGDTGKAALEGYHDVPGVEIMVFYPDAGTSEIQRLQMETQAGDNVSVYAVQGNFDDAQTGVKRVFMDAELAESLAQRNICLSSANSINWGRLVPQIVYYFAAYFSLLRDGAVQMGQPVDFCVPTGNFGDILAGYYAKQMGLPVGRLVCASNCNNVLTDFITTGLYDARRTFHKTTSPSMDILVSSNLERLLYHVTGDAEKVSGYMAKLGQEGHYMVEPETLYAIQKDFACGCATDQEVAEEIRRCYAENGYLCDTHTAVAMKVARDYRAAQTEAEEHPMVVLSTASPFKFPRAVLEALGQQADENDFTAMHQLEQFVAQTAPESLRALDGKPVRFHTVIQPADISKIAWE